MHLQHFEFSESPFSITPNLKSFFLGARRGATLEALIYAVTSDEGIVKVSGEIGAGKTLLCRILPERLPKNVDAVYLATPSLRRGEMIQAIAHELGIQLTGKRPHLLLRSLQDQLEIRQANGQKTVVMIDEAHALSIEALEEVRLLSNLESDQRKLLHIALFGQAELNKRLASVEMRLLKERITHNFALESLNKNEIADYIQFCLRSVGCKRTDFFTPKAINLLAEASEGLARRINVLADKAIIAAYVEGKYQIDVKHVESAINDAQFYVTRPKNHFSPRWRFVFAAIIGGVLLLFTANRFYFSRALLTEPPALVIAKNEKSESVPNLEVTSASATAINSASSAPVLNTSNTASPVERAPEIVATQTPEIMATTNINRTEVSFDARLETSKTWLENAPNEHFFIQLLTIDAKSQVDAEKFVARISKLLDPAQIRLYRSKLSGRERLGVIYGDYATQEDAQAGLKEVMRHDFLRSSYLRTVQKLR